MKGSYLKKGKGRYISSPQVSWHTSSKKLKKTQADKTCAPLTTYHTSHFPVSELSLFTMQNYIQMQQYVNQTGSSQTVTGLSYLLFKVCWG